MLKRRRHLKQTKQCFGSERIAGYSNECVVALTMFCGLEGDKITGLSIRLSLTEVECIKALEVKEITGYSNSVTCQRQQSISSLQILGLDGGEITWYSNSCCYRSTRFGEEKATWYSNPVWQTIVMVCKKGKIAWFSNDVQYRS